ncbi:MAG: hypothetical protein OQK25_03635 [Gammaproteobacteria bacterium]|nr:hypothetical protein [Gammaproteobacteria bacterium]
MMEAQSFTIDEISRKKARQPHELIMLNLAIFHLLLAVGLIALDIGQLGMLIPVLFSILLFGYIYWRGGQFNPITEWFVMVNWRQALLRGRLLFIGYGLTALIITLAQLMAEGDKAEIFQVVFTRIGVMPTVILVFAVLVLESSSLEQISRGRVPVGMLRRYPPPQEVNQSVG